MARPAASTVSHIRPPVASPGRLPRRGVYILHFDRPLAHARHYTGWSSDLPARLAAHERGAGARLVEVIRDLGIGWTLAGVWSGATRTDERRMKRRGGAARVCPVCRGTGVA